MQHPSRAAGWARGLSTLLSVLVAACAPVEPTGLAREGIVVPGDWTPPDSTLAISNPQYVEVVDPPPVLPLGSCASSCPDDIWGGLCTHPACTRAHPGTAELDAYIRGRWTYVRAGGTYSCRRNSNPASCENLSVHSIGRAIDLMITEIGGDADNTAGDAVANWLIENAEYIGIQRVIWDGRYWNGSRRGAHFSDISDRLCGSRYCTDHHTNHIHVELSVDGAARRTRFFTEGAPPTTCPVVCYGTAAVRADCSYVDCAATGEVCLPDPVRCGPGAPPEPATASMNASAPRPTISALGGLGRVRPTTPTRLFDTRTIVGSAALVLSDGATMGPLGSMRSGTLAASPTFASDAIGAVLNVAAVPTDLAGVVTVFPQGPQPGISTVNYAPPRVRANATIVSLATGGVSFASTANAHLVTDSSAVIVPGAGLGLRTAGPLRVLDTRALDTPLVAGAPFPVTVGAPADARGVIASVAVIQAGADAGFVTAFPCGMPTPTTSSINFIGSSVTANTVISELGDGSAVCFVSTHPVHLVVDVTGYLVPEGELSYQAVAPVRLLDSRDDTSPWVGRLGAGQVIELPIAALAGMPADVRAVTVNLTTVSPGSRGFVTAYPCGISPPSTSSLNFDSDNAAGALSISAIGSGSLCLVANQRTYLIVDLLGVWVPTPGAPPPTDGPGPMPDEPENPDPPMTAADAGIAAPDDAGTASDADLVALDARGADVGASGHLSGSCSCRAPGHGTRTAAAGWLALALASLACIRGRGRSTRRAR